MAFACRITPTVICLPHPRMVADAGPNLRLHPISFHHQRAEHAADQRIVFCAVNSWLTGSKLVSLPFSDHCEPLLDDAADLDLLLTAVRRPEMDKFKYSEIRPRSLDNVTADRWMLHGQYWLHVLELEGDVQELYSRLHKDGVQRKLRRAEREHLRVVQGRTDLLLQQFYDLLVLTRRRHQLPPQPFVWFRNLVESLGDRLTIYVAHVKERPIASILTLRHKDTIVYKYGCSDEKFHNLGGMPSLFWHAIQEAKSEGLHEFDLGRSDVSNAGLIRFKDHLGALKRSLNYWRFSAKAATGVDTLHGPLESVFVRRVIAHLPDRLFRLAGQIFYRHAG